MIRRTFPLLALLLATGAASAAPSEVDTAMETLKTSKDHQVRLQAVKKLGQLKDPKAIPALIVALEPAGADPEEDWFVGREAGRSLAAIGKPSLDPLMATLKHEKPLIRRRALDAITLLRPPDIQALLAKTIKGDADPSVRGAAAMRMRDLKDKAAIPVLKEVAEKDADEGVKKHARQAIEKLEANP